MSIASQNTLVYIAQANNLRVGEVVKVKAEDIDSDRVRHVCRNGLTELDRRSFEFNQPQDAYNRTYKRVECSIWNCSYCGKTYYYYQESPLMRNY